MALGARRAAVVGMVLREALIMAGCGVAIGIPVALAASRLSRTVLNEILFGLGPNNPVAIVSASVVLVVVVVLAGYLPRAGPRVSTRWSRCAASRPGSCFKTDVGSAFRRT